MRLPGPVAVLVFLLVAPCSQAEDNQLHRWPSCFAREEYVVVAAVHTGELTREAVTAALARIGNGHLDDLAALEGKTLDLIPALPCRAYLCVAEDDGTAHVFAVVPLPDEAGERATVEMKLATFVDEFRQHDERLRQERRGEWQVFHASETGPPQGFFDPLPEPVGLPAPYPADCQFALTARLRLFEDNLHEKLAAAKDDDERNLFLAASKLRRVTAAVHLSGEPRLQAVISCEDAESTAKAPKVLQTMMIGALGEQLQAAIAGDDVGFLLKRAVTELLQSPPQVDGTTVTLSMSADALSLIMPPAQTEDEQQGKVPPVDP